MPSQRKDDPANRVYADTRISMTKRGFLKWWPSDFEERTLLIGNWILWLRSPHAIAFDYMWRWIEQEFPDEVEEARERIRECDRAARKQLQPGAQNQ